MLECSVGSARDSSIKHRNIPDYAPKARFGWLVVLGLYRAVSKRGRKRREKIDESKNVQTTPPAPTASAIGNCPTVVGWLILGLTAL